jgi:Purple acid Phosphatase, N-terminal domain
MLVFKLPLYCLLTLSSACAFLINTLEDFQPQQIHIAYSGSSIYAFLLFFVSISGNIVLTDKPSQLTITWNTVDNPKSSIVEYGFHEESLNLSATGSIQEFVDGGQAKRKLYIHKIKLAKLSPGRKYCNI